MDGERHDGERDDDSRHALGQIGRTFQQGDQRAAVARGEKAQRQGQTVVTTAPARPIAERSDRRADDQQAGETSPG